MIYSPNVVISPNQYSQKYTNHNCLDHIVQKKLLQKATTRVYTDKCYKQLTYKLRRKKFHKEYYKNYDNNLPQIVITIIKLITVI